MLLARLADLLNPQKISNFSINLALLVRLAITICF